MKVVVFHITTKGFITFKNKQEFYQFVSDTTHRVINERSTIKELAYMLPREEYCTILKGGVML